MWRDVTRHLRDFESAVLTGVDVEGYPFSIRCRPEPDPATRTLRVQLPADLPIQPGPGSLLCHRHDQRLWNQKSFLVRGVLTGEPSGWVFRPSQFIPGAGIGGMKGLLRFVVSSRRAAQRYLAARGLRRPGIPWAQINATKAQVQRSTR